MSSESKSVRPLCVGGCGFHGSLETRNMCSTCHNDFLKERIAKSSAGTDAPTPSITENRVSVNAVAGSADMIEPSPAAVKKRCQGCNKKLGLMGFTCRCGKVFCGQHRYPMEHSCSFDFKTLDRKILVKQNPVVKGEKLDARI